jgi:hypothetical protein
MKFLLATAFIGALLVSAAMPALSADLNQPPNPAAAPRAAATVTTTTTTTANDIDFADREDVFLRKAQAKVQDWFQQIAGWFASNEDRATQSLREASQNLQDRWNRATQ